LHSFTKVVITEEYANRVQGFRIDRWNGSTWATVHTGTTIGSNRVIQLAAPVSASAVRLVVTAASAPVTISELWFNP
jgi:alpha-L-fucosidase